MLENDEPEIIITPVEKRKYQRKNPKSTTPEIMENPASEYIKFLNIQVLNLFILFYFVF